MLKIAICIFLVMAVPGFVAIAHAAEYMTAEIPFPPPLPPPEPELPPARPGLLPVELPPPPISLAHVMRFTIDSTTFIDGGIHRTLDAAPFIAQDRTMVPLRVIMEAMGATDLTLTGSVVTFNLRGTGFTMTIGQPLPNNLGTPVIVADRTFVPIQYVINEVGALSRWDGSARAAYIYFDV